MDTLPVINKTYELYKWITQTNDILEKRWRHSLGRSLENTTLDLLADLIMAKNAPKAMKSTYLLKASASQEIATLKLRLYLELDLANETKISQAQAILSETGRMLGGWLKSLGAS